MRLTALLQLMVTRSAAVLILACSAYSATFYSPTGVTLVQSSAFFPVNNLVQGPGVGFAAAEPHNATGSTWVTNAIVPDYYPAGATPILRFDLGSDVVLSEISTWGYANTNSNGAKDFSLRFATAADGIGGFGTSIAYNPGFVAAFSATARDTHAFSQLVTARYVEMTITDNYRGNGFPGGDRVGLGEVAFEAAGTGAWDSGQAVSIGHIWAQLSVTLNIDFANALLVWDTSDQGTLDPADWAGSTSIGAVTAGSVLAPATPLTPNTAYVARFYGVDGAGAAGWSDPISFSSHAAPFYDATPSLVQSSQYFSVANLGQGEASGFSAASPYNQLGGGGAGYTWVTNASGGDYYAAPIGATPIIRFDLGSDVLLREISTWGYADGNVNGAKDFSLRFATDAEGTGGFGSSIAYNPTFIAAHPYSPRSHHAFSEFVTARYVEMTITDNYYGSGAGGDRVGLGEVAFGASGLVAWTDEAQPSRGNTWAQLTALLNTNVSNAILVWDSSDQGTTLGAWANSYTLGSQNAGQVISQASPLAASTSYVARFYAVNGAEQGWSEPISFTTSAAPFYSATSSLGQSSQFYPAVNLAQGEGAGFDATAPYNQLGAVSAAYSWVTNASGADYFTPPIGTTPILHFDLGSDVLLSEISTWNYAAGNRGRDFTLRFATDAEGLGNFGSSITYSPMFIAGPDYTARDSHDLNGHVMARYVEMTILDNYRGFSGGGSGGDRVGMGEVAFEQIPQAAGALLWFNHSAVIDAPSKATLQASVNRDLATTVLVWDTSDKGTGATGDWPNSVSLGAQSAGAISERITGLLQNTTYIWRFYGVDTLGTAGWSDAVTLDNGVFYSAHPILMQSSQFFPISRIAQGVGVGIGASSPYNQLGGSNTWVTNASGGDYYTGTVGPTPIIVFDLGSDVLLSEISTWGYADSNANGAKDFSLRFATSADGTDNFGTSVTYNPSFVAAHAYTPRDTHRFSEWVRARYVELTITDNYAGVPGAGPGGDRVGLGEVAFERTFPATVIHFR